MPFSSTGLHWLGDAVWMIYTFTVLVVAVIVVSENRNPVKTLAWITVLLVMPVVGGVLYFFFGRSIKNKRKLSRRNRRKLKKRAPKSDVPYSELQISRDNLQHARLAHSLSGSQVYAGNSVEVFTDGRSKFNSLKNDLRSATKYINLQYYIFEDDDLGTEIADILIERASHGVEVRVIYDHVGSFSVKNSFFKKMRRAGVQIYPFFRVIFPLFGSRINWRNHRKLVVIDGKTGYLGGMNIAGRYIDGGRKFSSWRDTHVRVEGPIVGALQFAFAVDWHFMGQPVPDQPVTATSAGVGGVSAQLLTAGPTSQWANISLMFLKAIGNAKRRIYIQTPYFLPTEALLNSLTNSALAGVDVRIIIPRHSDSRLLDHASTSYVTECLRAGIKIYLYEAGMLHSKMIIIDDDFVTIGSTNFDFRSFEHNFESNIFFYSAELCEKMLKVFADDLSKSTRVLPDKWRTRPIQKRALESIVRLLSPIL